MIDPIDLLLRENGLDVVVECLGRVEIVPKRFLDDDPPPVSVLLLGKTGLAKLLHDLTEKLRGRCHVEQVILVGAELLVDGTKHLTKLCKGGRIAKITAHVVERLLKTVPRLGSVVLRLEKSAYFLAKVVQAHVIDSDADHRKFSRQ